MKGKIYNPSVKFTKRAKIRPYYGCEQLLHQVTVHKHEQSLYHFK